MAGKRQPASTSVTTLPAILIEVHNYKMESDFVYFDPSINSELAKYLNECARKEEEMAEEEAYEAFLKSIPIG